MVPPRVRRSLLHVLARAGTTRVGRAVAAGLTPSGLPRSSGGPAVDPVEAVDAVEFGHRLILGRPPSPELRQAMVAELANGLTTPAQAWASIAASAEFAGRVAHQRAVVDSFAPVDDPSLLRVEDVRDAQSISAHNASAESYFAGRSADDVEQLLSKPFVTAAENTELLTCFGHVVAGLDLVPGDRLLDFGIGSGWTSWMFAQLRAEVVGVDVSASALDHARQRFKRWPLSAGRVAPSFLVFDGLRLDLDDDSIDKICCFDAFHHLANQEAVLAEFARVLRPGGLAVFSEPGAYNSRTTQAQYEMARYGVIEGDVELGAIAAMAAAAGLEFVAVDVLTAHPIWVSRERFTDLTATQVVDAGVAQQLAQQVVNKQQFVLRKPGGAGLDSRSARALGATLTLEQLRVEPTPTGGTLHVTLAVANTGEGRWLPTSEGVGHVALGLRSLHRSGWEARLDVDGSLALRPGESAVVAATVDLLPEDLADDSLHLNLVSEHVTWFDLAGTPPIDLRL